MPHFLPNGRAVLFFIAAGTHNRDLAQVAVYDLETGQRRTLVAGTSPKYAEGHLVFWRGGSIWALRFDPVRLQTQGDPIRVADGILADSGGFASFSVGRDGALLATSFFRRPVGERWAMQIEMTIKGLMVDPVTNMPIVILRDDDGERVLPLRVGIFEANAIALQIENIPTPRPMTHDLLRNVIEDLKACLPPWCTTRHEQP